MNLDEAQKQKVAEWIEAGLKIAEIQKRLEADFGLRPTYMEVRLLIDDLKLVPKNPAPPKQEIVNPSPAPAAQTAAASPGELAPEPAAGGGVAVSLDKIARPGAMVSGSVTFSDGQTAAWYLDETGRLGLVAAQQGYKPTPADVQAFQRALQVEMQKLGY